MWYVKGMERLPPSSTSEGIGDVSALSIKGSPLPSPKRLPRQAEAFPIGSPMSVQCDFIVMLG